VFSTPVGTGGRLRCGERRRRLSGDVFEPSDDLRAAQTQFVTVESGDLNQYLQPAGCQGDVDLSSVIRGDLASGQPQCGQTIYQTDRAIVTYLQTLRQLTDRHIIPPRKALDRQQRLMLLRRQAVCVRRLFAKA
jgi:hypothetical protein